MKKQSSRIAAGGNNFAVEADIGDRPQAGGAVERV
jgi:hypothetical protein